MEGNTLEVEWVAIERLALNPANPRRNEAAVPHVAASLRRFGWRQPIVARPSGEVIAGNTRLKAAQQLGMATVPVVWFQGSDLEATAYSIADNRTAEFAEWDGPALATLLQELRAEDALDGVGYSSEDIDALLADLEAQKPPADLDDPGPGPPPVHPVTLSGDIWILGEHRILCGDSTKPEDVARLMAGEMAALLSTDPPYCVDYTGNNRPVHEGKKSGKDWSHVYREVDIADLGQFLDAVFTATLPHVQETTGIYVWHAHMQQPVIAATFERHGLLLHQVLVWVKPTPVFGHSWFQWRHEPCAFGWRKGHKPEHGQAQLNTVWEVDWEGKSRIVGNEHPCLHPDALVLTEAGYRPIRSIAVGDRVYAADGRFHPVSDVSRHPYRSPDLIRIVAKGGNVATEASDNHPFLIWRPEREGTPVAWTRADEVRGADFTMTPLPDPASAEPLPEGELEGLRELPQVEHEGRHYGVRMVTAVERVPYSGDVWNLSVDGNPSFQTAVGMSHNTQKPLRLFEIPMEVHTGPGDLVLEPFSGSGSQILAAERLRRKCRALEISPAFVDVAVRRFELATGKTAVLEATDRSFRQTAAERGVEIS